MTPEQINARIATLLAKFSKQDPEWTARVLPTGTQGIEDDSA
jgi:hypothetical protein